MRLLFATSNPHKIREVAAILSEANVQAVSLDSLDLSIPEPEETGNTFAENARIKAIAYARASGIACLAEDSGLSVDALHGAPGVHSARYSGTTGPRDERDALNNRKLLDALANVPDEQRSARFVCAMCIAAPSGEILTETEGTFEGRIARSLSGENGFGYDPLLYLPQFGCTSAQLPPAQKNALSHRGKAARALVPELHRLFPAD
ncbi:MAG TPA: RdgB/HAM1 family non-canonical purine NTP pyrophosphatase [Polyangiaceae bacterium]|jgi:XTP/dITP diphosphohydrolase|nr:RdgB/HAM1 family non-canonical purine NTP pyrophosphatase [Polyangiaceae bacterium]